ncbi:carboxylesterase [Rhodobacteraceae bacterium 2CG4]|uniref:Carboxylesterase n=1 Tax=Halovulum marinum TaxID=2662447 RepID=A0A6L5Z124_9RHOB|nr:holin family protein [Halovulum marinum]MSU90009.1 carboxylesterase [Halovulum marinum]
MGVMQALGLIPALRRTAEVFVANRTERARQEHAENIASLEQLGTEFARPRAGVFDGLVDALNRLPRPALALGTLGLFGFAMADPVAFGVRMQGLALVPEPLWWLLGAIVSFYFGARELNYFRGARAATDPAAVSRTVDAMTQLRTLAAPEAPPEAPAPEAPAPEAPEARAPLGVDPAAANPALAEWRARQSQQSRQ